MGAVDEFLGAVTAAAVGRSDLWASDASMDATVPNWRIRIRGADQIRRVLSGWYADPGAFEELRRIPLPAGELVEFLLTWTEHGVPHAARQAHVIRLSGDRIVDHVVYCGGRWPAGLLARMAEAADV